MDNRLEKIRELVDTLNNASKAYYQENKEVISNYEYDQLYDELIGLERESGIVLSNSPTINVGYELLSSLPKEAHNKKMLSLDKTKDVQALVSWIDDYEGLLSYKLDGLTIVLTYDNGELVKGVTRGNGEVGEVITNNVKVFKNIPLNIPYKEHLIIRGEAVIPYTFFNQINESLDTENQYKNPRNLCSGSVRQLNNEITAKRHVMFYGFTLVESAHTDFETKMNKLEFLKAQGFDIVETIRVNKDNLEEKIHYFRDKISHNDVASDGLVLTYNSVEYSNSLGETSKFPKDSIAFKWQDETALTTLKSIEWSPSRTGLINPVAIFESVELEGTTVSRASLHNLSIIEELELGIGDEIEVFKANMIIPQVAVNHTKSGQINTPKSCPICNEETVVKNANGVKTLYCSNPFCPAKMIKSFTHFVSRDGMNIEGLSEATLEKLIQEGILKDLSDIYRIENHQEMIINMEGLGEKSFNKLIKSIEASKTVNLPNFIYALGILNVGLSNAKLLAQNYNNDFNAIKETTVDEMLEIDGFGEVISRSLYDYFNDDEKVQIINQLMEFISFNEVENDQEQKFEGITFVITGSLNHFNNRGELKEVIENQGGKVSASVSSKTNYLINNDQLSQSSKNKKAKSLNIPILTEEDFMKL